MVPLSLVLRNFLSYRDTVTIDMSNLTLACLSGANGAGKSALLDAMTWAVWGKSRAQRDIDLISLGEEETEVTFVFRMGGRDYRIMRRRTRSNRPTLEFDSRAIVSDNWLPIGGDSIRDTEARIVRELRLDYDTFVNSAFLKQGDADRFTEHPPRERKRILADILDLSVYDELAALARAEGRGCRERMDGIQERIGRIDMALSERHEIEVTLADLEDRLERGAESQRELQERIDALGARLAAAEQTESALKRAAARLDRLAGHIVDCERRAAKTTMEIDRLKAITAREGDIRKNVDELRRWRRRADALAAALAERQPLERRITELESAIQRERAGLDRRLAVLSQSARSINERLADLDRSRAALDGLARQIEAGRQDVERLTEARALADECQDRLNELLAENGTLRSRMDEIKGKIEALSAGEANCPICRRPLAEGDHQHIHDAWALDGKELGDAFRANQAEVAALKTTLTGQRAEIERLDAVAQAVVRAEAQAQQLRDRLGDRDELADESKRTAAEIERVGNVIASNDYCHDERAELDGLRSRLGGIEYDPEKHASAREHVQRLESAERDLSRLEQARTEMAALKERLSDLEDQMGTASADRKETQKEVDELHAALEGIDDVRRLHGEAARDLEALVRARQALEREHGGLQRRLQELDERAKEKEQLEAEAGELSARLDAFGELSTAFGRNGIQAMVIENVLPELEDETNRLLTRMTTKPLEVRFHTTREAVSSDRDIETLDIIIRDEAGRRPYQMFSGGEAFRINFAIRVALSKLLARRAGASVDTLIVDEGFGTQDQQGRDGLVEALQSVASDFEFILVITHIDELRDQFPNRIEIVKTDAGSRATLI